MVLFSSVSLCQNANSCSQVVTFQVHNHMSTSCLCVNKYQRVLITLPNAGQVCLFMFCKPADHCVASIEANLECLELEISICQWFTLYYQKWIFGTIESPSHMNLISQLICEKFREMEAESMIG